MKKKKRHIMLYIVSILLISIIGIAALGSYYVVSSVNKMSNNTAKSTDGTVVEIPKIDSNKLNIPVTEEETNNFSDKITNIAVFGIDERAPEYDGDWARADSIIILTIDEKNNKIKLSSVLRDTYVNVLEYGNTIKDKINHSFAYGAGEEYAVTHNALLAYHAGAVRTIETLNDDFKLDIKDYVIFNFNSFKNVIDRLGGIDINLTQIEINRINASASNPVPDGEGFKTLNGEQALIYARDRYDGTDTDRSLRQRNVMGAVAKKMQTVNIVGLPGVIGELLTAVKTSFDMNEIFSISLKVLTSKMSMESTRFPVDGNWSSEMIGGVSYDVILDEGLNLNQIRDFIYNDILPQGNFTTTTAPQ
ncbi:MAG: LCP family protein [Oscillospiraceae bacterium]|nr:LCP family protein [Oscillospiraceae bacterium]